MQHNQLHYPTLDRCKKLTELGFPITALGNGEHIGEDSKILDIDYCIKAEKANSYFSYTLCPSVMEMLDVIPKDIFYDIFPYQEKQEYFVEIISSTCFKSISSDTIPNALADMIIWLVENNYLSFKK